MPNSPTTSTVVGRALHDGVLRGIDDPVTTYVDIEGGYAEPTIRDVMMMSSGVNFFHHQGTPNRLDMYARIWIGDEDMGGDAIWSQHADGEAGHAFGHACLCPRLLEFAHLGQLYIQDGVWNGRRLLPEGFVAESGSPRAPFQEPSEGERGYGYQWWVPWRSRGESMALGAFGQILWVDLERGVSIAQFAAHGGGENGEPDPEGTEDTHAAMRAIAAAVAG